MAQKLSTEEAKKILEKLDAYTEEQVANFLVNNIGNMELNESLKSLKQENLTENEIGFKNFVSYFTYKTRDYNKTINSLNKLNNTKELLKNKLPIKDYDKISLKEYGQIKNLCSINNKYNEYLEDLNNKTTNNNFKKIFTNIKDANIQINNLQKELDTKRGLYKSGDLMMYLTSKTSAIKNRQNWLEHEGKLEEIFVTKYNHAAPIYIDKNNQDKIIGQKSDVWGKQRLDKIKTDEILESEIYRIDPTKLVNKEFIKHLENTDYGYKNDNNGNQVKITWQEMIRNRYEELSYALHDGIQASQVKKINQEINKQYEVLKEKTELFLQNEEKVNDKVNIFNAKYAEYEQTNDELQSLNYICNITKKNLDSTEILRNNLIKDLEEQAKIFDEQNIELDIDVIFQTQLSRIEQIEENLNTQNAELENLRTQYTELEKIKDNQEEQLNILDEEIEQQKNQNNNLEQECSHLQSEIGNNQQKIQNLNNNLIQNDQDRLGNIKHWVGPSAKIKGHKNLFSEESLQKISENMFNARNPEQLKMICSEFSGRSIVSVIYQLNRLTALDLKASGKITETEDVNIINSPISKNEKFDKLNPERLITLLKDSGCVEEIKNPILDNLILADKPKLQQTENIDQNLPKKILNFLEKGDNFQKNTKKLVNIYLTSKGIEEDAKEEILNSLNEELPKLQEQYNKQPEGFIEKVQDFFIKILEACHLRTKNKNIKEAIDNLTKEYIKPETIEKTEAQEELDNKNLEQNITTNITATEEQKKSWTNKIQKKENNTIIQKKENHKSHSDKLEKERTEINQNREIS